MIPTALALDAEPPPEALASADDLPRLLDEIHRFVAAFVRPAADAEDVTAEAFRAAVARLRFPIPRQEARAFLLTVARRRIADHRRQRRHKPLTEGLAIEGDPALGPAVRAVLAELPEDQAGALILKYALGLSAEETALALKRSVPATHSLLQRARAAFAQKGAFLNDGEPR